MAYQSTYLTDEEKKKLAESGINTSGIIGSYTSPSSPAGGAAGAAPQPEKTPGTGYVNLAQYLDMNKGQGASLADTVTADVRKGISDYTTGAQKALDESSGKFNEASGSGRASEVKSAITQDAAGQKQAAKDFLGSAYSGPTAADYTTGLSQQKSDLGSKLSKVDDFETQQQALAKAYGGGYRSGYGLLDTFLLRGDESGQKRISDVKSTDLGTTYDRAAQELSAREQAARQKLEENKKSVIDTAIGKKSAVENEGLSRLQELERAHEPFKENEGYKSGSLGDVLQDKEKLDLEALAEIARLDPNSDWYKKTFDVGRAKPGQTPIAPVASEPKVQESIAETRDTLKDPEKAIKDIAKDRGIVQPIDDLNRVPWNTAGAIDDFVKRPSVDRLQTIHDEGFKKPLNTIETMGENVARESVEGLDRGNDIAARQARGVEKFANEGSDNLPPILEKPLQGAAKVAAPILTKSAEAGDKIIEGVKKVQDFGNDLGDRLNEPLTIPKLKNLFGGGGGGGTVLTDKQGNVISGSGASGKQAGKITKKGPQQAR